MALLKRMHWDERVSIGVPEIDRQHQILFSVINQLMGLHEEGATDTFDILEQLTHYLNYHFHTEHTLMLGLDYPDFQEHSASHQNFIDRVLGFLDDYEHSKMPPPRDLLAFLHEWFIQHILQTDRRLGAFLQRQRRNKRLAAPPE